MLLLIVFLLTSIDWPYRGLRYRPTEFQCFLKLSADKLLLFKWSQAQVPFFKNAYEISRVHEPHFSNVDFELTSDAKIQPSFTYECREGDFLLSRVDHALRPILMFWLVKIWQVSSCGKFMQRLETCLLIAEADRVLCHLVMF